MGRLSGQGRTAESMMQFGKAVRRYCHVSVQYVQPLTVRPHLYMNAAAPLYHPVAAIRAEWRHECEHLTRLLMQLQLMEAPASIHGSAKGPIGQPT